MDRERTMFGVRARVLVGASVGVAIAVVSIVACGGRDGVQIGDLSPTTPPPRRADDADLPSPGDGGDDSSTSTSTSNDGSADADAGATTPPCAGCKAVLFGGFATSVLADIWEWDGATWTQRAVAGPSPRSTFAMASEVLTLSSSAYDGLVSSSEGPSAIMLTSPSW
jgi:hypothetical protein